METIVLSADAAPCYLSRMSDGRRAAVFLDRDGVLNLDTGYVHRPDQIVWTPEAAQAVRAINAAGRLALVVTNQSGIARGLYGAPDVEALHVWMAEELARQGARIDAWRYCPHHPDVGGACDCRKPNPGLLLGLMTEFDVDPTQSFMIGDRASDMQAAAAAGVVGLIYEGVGLSARVAEGLARTRR